jgi:putative sigma-54 modulation protein
MLLTAHPKSKSVHITDDTRAYLEKKLNKFHKHFRNEPQVQFTQGFERGQHIVEITLHGDDILLRSQERNGDLHAAIDRVIDRLDTQLKRFKSKRIDSHRQQSAIKAEAEAALAEVEGNGFRPHIARRKLFKMERMSPIEAARRMEMVEHGFYLFLNDETNRLAVLYRREGGDYGLIEPEV